MTAEYRLLGDVAALVDGVPLDLGHARQRALLAVLLVEANRPVRTDLLVDRAWGEQRPRQARDTLYSYLSRIRRALATAGGVELVREAGGYILRVDESTVDLHRFRALLRQARADSVDEAAYTAAFGLWRGRPFPDLDTPWFASVRRDLERECYAARLDHADCVLDAGRHADLLPDLERRAAQHPLDERIAGQLLRALCHGGRQADALRHYERVRERLADELGVDPGQPLRDLHRQVLRGELHPAHRTPTPRQLPAAPRRFVGRTAELSALDATVSEGAVAVIVGAGGIGKTWLALRWADEHRDRFPDGQIFVNLRGFTPSGEPLSPGAAVRGFLATLGLAPGAEPRDPAAQVGLYRSLVAGRRMLILLDNARDSDQVEELLPGGSRAAVIVTSRDRLAGLVSRHEARAIPLDVLHDADAHRLLVDRLGEDRLDGQAEAVAAVVAHCAGLPLALAIAAARIATRPGSPVAAVAAELSETTTRLSALDEGLRAVLDGSYRALTPTQARVFGLLGGAPGPDIGGWAAAALTGLPVTAVSAALRELERQSLLGQQLPGRWRMHDLVRLYAQECAPGDAPAAQLRLLRFWVHTAWSAARLLAPHRPPIPLDAETLAAIAEPLLHPGAATAWFDREYAGLLAGQRLASDQSWHPTVWQLAWSLHTYQHRRGHLTDTVRVWQVALAAARHAADPIAQIRAHRQLGRAHSDLNRYAQAIEQIELALRLADAAGDLASQAETWLTLGQTYNMMGDDERAMIHSTEALRIYEKLDNPVRRAVALNAVGWHATRLGQYAHARAHLDAALALQRLHHDRTYLADTLDSQGFLALRTGEHADALGYFTEALTLLHDIGDAYGEADTVTHLGDTHAALGDHDRARREWDAALRLYEGQHRHNEATQVRARLGSF